MRCGEKAELRDACVGVGLAVDRNYCSVSEREMKERKMGMTAEEETCFLYVGGGSYPTKIQHQQKKDDVVNRRRQL